MCILATVSQSSEINITSLHLVTIVADDLPEGEVSKVLPANSEAKYL